MFKSIYILILRAQVRVQEMRVSRARKNYEKYSK